MLLKRLYTIKDVFGPGVRAHQRSEGLTGEAGRTHAVEAIGQVDTRPAVQAGRGGTLVDVDFTVFACKIISSTTYSVYVDAARIRNAATNTDIFT